MANGTKPRTGVKEAAMGADTEREKAVDLAIAQIERQFGKGSIMRLGGGEMISEIPDRKSVV